MLTNTPFERIEIKDESLPHPSCPTPHNDYVYVTVNYDITPDKFIDITSLTGSITYDPFKKLLCVRCGTIESVVAILALCTQIGEGHLSINYIEANDLYPKYFEASQNPEQYNRLYDLMCYNLGFLA